jgi:hypothetical protein
MEMNDVTSSENRLWLKLDKTFFSFEKDLYICACYIPPVNSVYYDDDFSKLEDEISPTESPTNDHLKHGPGRQYKDLLIADLVH